MIQTGICAYYLFAIIGRWLRAWREPATTAAASDDIWLTRRRARRAHTAHAPRGHCAHRFRLRRAAPDWRDA